MTPSGRLRVTGERAESWLATIAQYESELVAALRASDLSSGSQAPASAADTGR
ncbi:MAG: hypothetical protein Q8Q19_02970 [Microbacterium sp.]|nr:hypothetical protein [Microbacterium sp.]